MTRSDSSVECRCPGCRMHHRRPVNPHEPPPRKVDYYLVFCEGCRKGSLYLPNGTFSTDG